MTRGQESESDHGDQQGVNSIGIYSKEAEEKRVGNTSEAREGRDENTDSHLDPETYKV